MVIQELLRESVIPGLIACPVLYTGESKRCPDASPAPHGVQGASRAPSQRINLGFRREPWIPAFAGMTTLIMTVKNFQIHDTSISSRYQVQTIPQIERIISPASSRSCLFTEWLKLADLFSRFSKRLVQFQDKVERIDCL